MIYSKKLGYNIPVQIESKSWNLLNYGKFTKYTIKDNKIPVGYVDLLDTPTGVHVEYVKNMNPQLYTGVGNLADRLEVEHCLNRGLDHFEIVSEAGLNSHALHFLRGKRFVSEKINLVVDNIIKQTPIGEKYNTKFLDKVDMFMPREMIQKYIEIIKKSPLSIKNIY